MHSYSYHLKIELYPRPLSTAPTVSDNIGGTTAASIWQRTPESTIFDILPSHPRRDDDGPTSTPSTKRDKQKGISRLEEYLPAEDRRLLHHNLARVIDCGASRSSPVDEGQEGDSSNNEFVNTGKRRERSKSFPAPGFRAGIGPRTAARDWRFGPIRIESFDVHDGQMADSHQPSPAASLGPNLGGPGTETKARFMPLECKNTEAGWGIVHLYREAHGLEPAADAAGEGLDGEDGTILCIPAVPSYLSPVGFLNFVGQRWLSDVAHYRMLMTSTLGTYMVLMKFRDRKAAEAWRNEFDGKAFGPLRDEAVCHVTFIKSITIETPSHGPIASSFSRKTSAVGQINSLKPFPPPTPDLVELPTCTVCLERMDETSGLITIPCQHVFHCTCLQSWRGSGCPVCRATNPAPIAADANDPYSHPFGQGISNICGRCDTTDDLWICLICGNVGCGRYKGAHAKEHWKETAHCFSLELETQHVWDYAGDMWVHRLIREKGEGKVVEFPSTHMAGRNGQAGNGQGGPDADVVPRAKLDNIGMEYTHLLTSQLESQRVYFEEIFSKAADKAAKAAAAAEAASSQAAEAMSKLRVLEADHQALRDGTIPQLERDLERERRRADKSTELARKLGQSLQEEKQLNKGLLEKVTHVNKEVDRLKAQAETLQAEVAEQKDINHDLTMFISGQEKLKEMEEEGKVTQEELDGGETSVPEKKGK
ncbi:zf-UBP-domain-containing protein, partial [Cryphonectria parasitica EP155]